MRAKLEALDDLEDDLAEDYGEITEKWEEIAADIETIEIGLEKSDIHVEELALLWIPVA